MRFAIIILALLTFCCCDSKVDRPEPVLTPQQVQQQNQAQAIQTIPSGAANVQHYYCANNCAGSGGDSAGTCPVCGSEYVHNQAWHNQGQNAISTQSTPAPEPAQNAAGVWHYTCSSGCSGGAGSAVACSQCGSTLVHNTAYHN